LARGFSYKVERGQVRKWLVAYPRALPVGIFVLVAAITMLSIYTIERSVRQRALIELSSRTVAISSALERRANASSAYLRAGAAMLASQDSVQPEVFRRFVSELRLDADYRGAQGIGWAMVVRPDEVDAFNTILAGGGQGDARLHPMPTGEQPIMAPVTYLHPDTQRNRDALGYDMYSEPVRRAAMIEAERTARPTATGKVVLVQDRQSLQPGFLIYMPVFEAAPGGRRLRGFIYSPFNAEDFLSSALALEDAGAYGVSIYDGAASPENLLASTIQPDGADVQVREQVQIANTPFVLELSESGGSVLSGLSMATLIFGLLVASLLMLVVRLLTRQAIEDEEAIGWFAEQASIRNSLTRELNHRVKNTLANVLSIIALTRRRADNLDDFASSLDGRIRALSATHDLLTMSDWGSTPIRAVIEAELRPYAMDTDRIVSIDGPDVELAPNDTLSLGLAVHELATNAAKYGALSQPGGNVSVQWEKVADELVRVTWQERGGPPVAAKRGRGFGTDLIERVVASELRQPVQLDFAEEGVRCELLIPVRRPSEFAIRAKRSQFEKQLSAAEFPD
jgi:two-component sensor histidine kinase